MTARTAPPSHRMFCGGAWVDAQDGSMREILSPSSGEVIARVPAAGAEDVDRAVEAALRAFGSWRDTTPGERSELLYEMSNRLLAHQEELAMLEARNVGQPYEFELGSVNWYAKEAVRFFAAAARCMTGPIAGEYLPGFTSMLRREPLGVCAGIAPWNYPIVMAIWKVAPALAAGNTVVLKPSELTPLTALRMAEPVDDLFPSGVFNVITGDGDPVGTRLVDHPDVAMVSLTGDVATGKEIARAAALTLKRVHLELGGKAPVIVRADADLEAAVAKITEFGFTHASGQDCTAATRLLVHESVVDRFVDLLVPAAEALVYGDPQRDPTVVMGPLISAAQQDRVLGFVQRAREAGAEVLTGGDRGTAPETGCFVAPTVVTNVAQHSEVVQDEVFGPVVTVQSFADDAAALRMANDVRYGLVSSVWTSDVTAALDFARRLDFGAVWINTHVTLAAEFPHGGIKQSGYGSDLSLNALSDYTYPKHVMAVSAGV